MGNDLTLESLETYLYCPLAYYWSRAEALERKKRSRSVRVLPRRLLLNTLRAYHKTGGQYALTDLLAQVVRLWLTKEGRAETEADVVLQYAAVRKKVLAVFRDGRVKKQDGSLYIQPQWSRKYRRMMESAGVGEMEKGMISLTESLGLAIPVRGEYRYHLGEAIGDAWDAVEQIKVPPAEDIVGVMLPAQVATDWGMLSFEMDMLSKDGRGAYVGWVVAADAWEEIGKSWVGRQPRVLATALGTCEVNGESIQPASVWYVDALRGWAHRRQSIALSRLGWLLAVAQRGIRFEVYPPRFLAESPRACQGCAFRNRCFVGHTEVDPLEHFLPGAARWDGKVEGKPVGSKTAEETL